MRLTIIMKLNITNITIGYSKPLISKGNMRLESGDVCLMIGDNGTGKTTLIKSILGQNDLKSGEILIDGFNLKTLTPKQIAEKIAVVFSSSEVPSNYTVKDLISFGKYIHYPYYFKLSKIDLQEVNDIIESLGLKEFENFQLQNLSDGNLQKAFIGRALAQNSPIIILDEPTTHLDEKNKLMILNLLRKIANTQNKIILFSSHDWRLSKEFSDKICFLKNQELQFGIAEDVLSKNPDLLSPKLFPINSDFSPPEIIAPQLQKEMLYSFLQKNSSKNLDSFKFNFIDGIWVVSHNDIQHKAITFKDIAELLSKFH